MKTEKITCNICMKDIGILPTREQDEIIYFDAHGKMCNTSFPTYISGVIHGHGTLVKNKMNSEIDICKECYDKIMSIVIKLRSGESK